MQYFIPCGQHCGGVRVCEKCETSAVDEGRLEWIRNRKGVEILVCRCTVLDGKIEHRETHDDGTTTRRRAGRKKIFRYSHFPFSEY